MKGGNIYGSDNHWAGVTVILKAMAIPAITAAWAVVFAAGCGGGSGNPAIQPSGQAAPACRETGILICDCDSGAAPGVRHKIVAPNGGEVICAGSACTVTVCIRGVDSLDAASFAETCNLALSADSGLSWTSLSKSRLNDASNRFVCLLPPRVRVAGNDSTIAPRGPRCLVRVSVYPESMAPFATPLEDSDISDRCFTIVD